MNFLAISEIHLVGKIQKIGSWEVDGINYFMEGIFFIFWDQNPLWILLIRQHCHSQELEPLPLFTRLAKACEGFIMRNFKRRKKSWEKFLKNHNRFIWKVEKNLFSREKMIFGKKKYFVFFTFQKIYTTINMIKNSLYKIN